MNKKAKRPCVAVMAKLPELGRVKTRLASELGDEKALTVYKALLSRLENLLLSLDAEIHIHYDGLSEPTSDFFPAFKHIPQLKGDLGFRMQSAIAKSMELSGKSVILTGADIPDLTESIFRRSFELLKQNDVVLGPSEDGGYYLIAMSELHQDLFQNIEWSTETVRNSTMTKCEELGLSLASTKELNDIDTLDDLKRSAFWSEVANKIENYGSTDSIE